MTDTSRRVERLKQQIRTQAEANRRAKADKDEEEKEDRVGNRNYPPYEGNGELRN